MQPARCAPAKPEGAKGGRYERWQFPQLVCSGRQLSSAASCRSSCNTHRSGETSSRNAVAQQQHDGLHRRLRRRALRVHGRPQRSRARHVMLPMGHGPKFRVLKARCGRRWNRRCDPSGCYGFPCRTLCPYKLISQGFLFTRSPASHEAVMRVVNRRLISTLGGLWRERQGGGYRVRLFGPSSLVVASGHHRARAGHQHGPPLQHGNLGPRRPRGTREDSRIRRPTGKLNLKGMMDAIKHMMRPYDTSNFSLAVFQVRASPDNRRTPSRVGVLTQRQTRAKEMPKYTLPDGHLDKGGASSSWNPNTSFHPLFRRLLPGLSGNMTWTDKIDHSPRNSCVDLR